MEVREHKIPLSNPLLADYLNKSVSNSSLFHYDPYEKESFVKRMNELSKYDFNREALVPYLEIFNQRYDADEKTLNNIKRLGQPDSLVVIGGQQAGILTGPIYTINKIITIIQQARLLEKQFERPVVPVFWIAGEDHDFAEINHTFINKNGQTRKLSVSQKWPNKHSISDVEIDKEACFIWMEKLFGHFGETVNTKEILRELKQSLDLSKTYVDFFARIIFSLFKDSGLILIDSGDKQLRKIEVPYFEKQIKQNIEIDKALNRQQEKLASATYPKIIDTELETAHLFYHLNGERILLHRKLQDGVLFFEGKQSECSFTEFELLDLLHTTPENFSNNVVTRPLMQEFLFPVLSFIAGPGEVAYWAELKQIFEVFDRKMPIVYPRLVTTIVEGCVMREIENMNFSMEEIIHNGLGSKKQEYLDLLKDKSISQEIQAMKQGLHNHYKTLQKAAREVHDSLSQIVLKNEGILSQQLDYLEQEFEKQNQKKDEINLQRFDRIQNLIKPNDQPQERMLNIFYFINLYGTSIVPKIVEETSSSEYTHKVIHI